MQILFSLFQFNMDDQVCPRCKTTKYRNPSLKLMVNICGHALCESCVDLLFLKGDTTYFFQLSFIYTGCKKVPTHLDIFGMDWDIHVILPLNLLKYLLWGFMIRKLTLVPLLSKIIAKFYVKTGNPFTFLKYWNTFPMHCKFLLYKMVLLNFIFKILS